MKRKTNLLWLFTIAICSIFAACRKEKTQEEQLPPATQTGANTFGCLINGKLYTPKGFEQNHPSFDMIVDPGFNDGQIDIRVFRKEANQVINLSFNSDSIRSEGIRYVNARCDFTFNIWNGDYISQKCITYYSQGQPMGKTGFVKITRYDLSNRIISGEFEFHFSNPDCGLGNPIDITQGRFDKHF